MHKDITSIIFALIIPYMNTVILKKSDILQHAGELSSKIYIVKSGLLRSYFIDEKGREHTFLFAYEGTTMVDHISPYLPTDLFIEALEDSIIHIFEKNLFNSKKNMVEVIGRIEYLQKRVIMLMSASIIERYKHFIHTYPAITRRIPQKMIASYLGVTPEALSKAKRKYLETNS